MAKWICPVCGYVHEGDAAPEKCPMCKVPGSKFNLVEEGQGLQFVTEHELWIAGTIPAGADGDFVRQGLEDHFLGECTEVGMYIAMSRQADREGYPEIAEAFKRYAYEEADHAARFAEMLGEVVWDTRPVIVPVSRGFIPASSRDSHWIHLHARINQALLPD